MSGQGYNVTTRMRRLKPLGKSRTANQAVRNLILLGKAHRKKPATLPRRISRLAVSFVPIITAPASKGGLHDGTAQGLHELKPMSKHIAMSHNGTDSHRIPWKADVHFNLVSLVQFDRKKG